MKTIRHNTLLRTLALGVLASCLGASVANARSFRGTFSLPAEVRWGTATLQAGNYTFTSEGAKTDDTLQLIQGGKVVAMVLCQSHNPAVAGHYRQYTRYGAAVNVPLHLCPDSRQAFAGKPYLFWFGHWQSYLWSHLRLYSTHGLTYR